MKNLERFFKGGDSKPQVQVRLTPIERQGYIDTYGQKTGTDIADAIDRYPTVRRSSERPIAMDQRQQLSNYSKAVSKYLEAANEYFESVRTDSNIEKELTEKYTSIYEIVRQNNLLVAHLAEKLAAHFDIKKLLKEVGAAYKQLEETYKEIQEISENERKERKERMKEITVYKPYIEKLGIQRRHADSKALFSGILTERILANEKAVTRAYLNIWKEQTSQPDIETFRTTYTSVQQIVTIDIIGRNSTEQEKDLQKISEINGNLREIAKKYPEQFRAALENAIKTTRTLHDWAMNFQDRFDLNENWVKAGMEALGVTKDNFQNSYQKLLDNPSNSNVPLVGPAVSDIVYGDSDSNCPPYKADKIVPTYEDFIRATTNLQYINDLLKDGIPVEGIPRQINRQAVVEVSGWGNDCLPRSLLRGAHPKWQEKFIDPTFRRRVDGKKDFQ